MDSLLPQLHQKLQFKHIIVGFSGGADSTALLLHLHQQSSHYNFSLEALHFQHNLRGNESKADEEWCRSFCRQYAIPFKVINLHLNTTTFKNDSLESAARSQRLAHFQDAVQAACAPATTVIALGHHSDDRIENVFIRLFRGSNCSGLVSMHAHEVINQVPVIRPLINTASEAIKAFLAHSRITDYRHDSSNNDNKFTRNYLRNKIIPDLHHVPGFTPKGVLQSLTALTEDAHYLDQQAQQAYNSCCNSDGSIKQATFTQLHNAIKIRVLRNWLCDMLPMHIVPSRRLFSRLLHELSIPHQRAIELPINGCRHYKIIVDKGTISVMTEQKQPSMPKAETIIWSWQQTAEIDFENYTFSICKVPVPDQLSLLTTDQTVVYFSEALSTNPRLLLRHWQFGDRMIPFSHRQPRKLKKIFSDHKVKNKQTPLLCLADDTIIWLPFIQRSTAFPVSSADSYAYQVKVSCKH